MSVGHTRRLARALRERPRLFVALVVVGEEGPNLSVIVVDVLAVSKTSPFVRGLVALTPPPTGEGVIEADVVWLDLLRLRPWLKGSISNLTLTFQSIYQTLEGSFSSVSTPNFARKYSLRNS